MTPAEKLKRVSTHVVDILGNTKGRDQPIMLMERAIELASLVGSPALADDDCVFLDPFCKAGEILLACALSRVARTLPTEVGTGAVKFISDEVYRRNRFFGLAPDERHFRLSLRTFFGNDGSHDQNLTANFIQGTYLSEIDGRLDHATFKRELDAMLEHIRKHAGKKRVIAIGNPPYQEADGGAGSSAKPIYNYFVESLMDSGRIDEFVVVIPARWFAGGKGLDSFREKLSKCGQVKRIKYFDRAEDVFPTVHVQGGVCFVHWARNHNGEVNFIHRDGAFDLDLSRFDIVLDDPTGAPIVEKVLAKWKGKYISSVAWSGKPFGLRTFYFQRNKSLSAGADGAVKCYTKGKKAKFVKRAAIEKNSDHIDRWKVAIPNAYATGARRCTIPKHQIFIIEKGAVSTETYNVVDSFQTRAEAESLVAYLQTDFVRYLLGLRKLTQHIPKDRWSWVPYVDISKPWDDRKLFEHFGLTPSEQKHIKAKIQEWT